MGLTSGTLMAGVVVCAALLFALTVGLWPRLARPGVRWVLGRVGLLVLVQLMVLASVGAAANRTFLLYDSWSDLAGTRPQAPAAPGGAAVEVLGRAGPGGARGSEPAGGWRDREGDDSR